MLVGEATQRAAGEAIAFEAAGDQVLKGKVSARSRPGGPCGSSPQRGGVGRAEALEAPFVGRDEELRQLKDLFHATSREGRPRLVSVIGPAGIGKSRLAWEFLKYIDGLVERVWWHDGRSPAYGEGITFWALGEMIRGRAGLQETDDEATTAGGDRGDGRASTSRTRRSGRGSSRRCSPCSGSNRGAAARSSSSAPGGPSSSASRRRGPVVMVFEDLHYADPGLLDFIDHLLEWSRTVPILIVTLARPELLERRPDWGAGKRSFTSIYLEPLPVEAMRELLAGLVPGLPGAARDAIVARADGIPLYAVETVRMLLAQGRLVARGWGLPAGRRPDDLAVPETLTALIAARLDELDAGRPGARRGRRRPRPELHAWPAVAAVVGRDAGEPRAAVAGARPARAARPGGRSASPERGQYAFVQALIREVAYNTLAKRDRKVRHLAAARYFESLGTDELAGALAGHYLAAQRLRRRRAPRPTPWRRRRGSRSAAPPSGRPRSARTTRRSPSSSRRSRSARPGRPGRPP